MREEDEEDEVVEYSTEWDLLQTLLTQFQEEWSALPLILFNLEQFRFILIVLFTLNILIILNAPFNLSVPFTLQIRSTLSALCTLDALFTLQGKIVLCVLQMRVVFPIGLLSSLF